MKKMAKRFSLVLVVALLLSMFTMTASADSYVPDQGNFSSGSTSAGLSLTSTYSYIKVYTNRSSGTYVNPALYVDGAPAPSQYYTIPKGPLTAGTKKLNYWHATAPFYCRVKFVTNGAGNYAIRQATSEKDCGEWQ